MIWKRGLELDRPSDNCHDDKDNKMTKRNVEATLNASKIIVKQLRGVGKKRDCLTKINGKG